MKNINQILKSDPLIQLIQKENFVGWTYSIDYQRALVMTNDLWKFKALGIPHNCFLLATTFEPESYAKTPDAEKEVLLLRVVGSCKLPQDDDLVRTRIDHFQGQPDQSNPRDYDEITQNQMQFGGLDCRVLGTFYTSKGDLWLGSDLESFAVASRLKVFRPRREALEIIVNYVDPMRRQKAKEDAADLGIKSEINPFPIGTVRYTSTARLHRQDNENVPVHVQPSDFLARRTAVLGMTRTGKSNMIKQMVSVVKKVATDGQLPIGQIIFDMNGEYANANRQDKGSIADAFPNETIRYRMLPADGFLPLQNNFYTELSEGHSLICELLKDGNKTSAADMGMFLNLSFDKPEDGDYGEIFKFNVRKAAYWGVLSKAGFKTNASLKTKFKANKDVVAAVNAVLENKEQQPLTPENGLTPAECAEWFLAARTASKSAISSTEEGEEESGTGKKKKKTSKNPLQDWLPDDVKAILNIMAQKNEKDSFIVGYKYFTDAVKFHTPDRAADVGREIYQHLSSGKIVILDLSVGLPSLREKITKRIAAHLFSASMGLFVEMKSPTNIVVYIEEAHNLIGKNSELDDIWPRIAKEGAKYKIALVYATQEVSAMHPNILANTENWFITHLNNTKEINELAKFYDFEDFSQSLIRAQDVGFARVKTLSGPFVIPVQIDKFDIDSLKAATKQR